MAILNLQCHSFTFQNLQMGVTLKARWCHSLAAFSLGPGLTVVLQFGGTPEPWTGSDETQPKMAHTTLLEFGECYHLYYYHQS